MNPNEYLKGRFLKQSDFAEPTRVEITRVEEVDVALPGEKPDVQPVIHFKGYDRPMVLNSTNIKRLIKAFGAETDDWIGQQIEVYVDEEVQYAGQITGGLRLRPIPLKARLAERQARQKGLSQSADESWEAGRDGHLMTACALSPPSFFRAAQWRLPLTISMPDSRWYRFQPAVRHLILPAGIGVSAASLQSSRQDC